MRGEGNPSASLGGMCCSDWRHQPVQVQSLSSSLPIVLWPGPNLSEEGALHNGVKGDGRQAWQDRSFIVRGPGQPGQRKG